MSRDDISKFSAGTMDKGVSARSMDFQPGVSLAITGYNLSQGLQQGLGPRPGMSTIPGQADNEPISGTRLPGLRGSEDVTTALSNRKKVLGVFTLKLPSPSDVTVKINAYAWLVTVVNSSVEYFDIVLSSVTGGGAVESISPNFYDGFGLSSSGGNAQTALNYFADAFVPISNNRVTPLNNYLQMQAPINNYLCAITMSVTGANVPTQWLLGEQETTGDATHAPNAAFHQAGSMYATGSHNHIFAAGVPTEYNLQNFTTTPRSIRVFSLIDTGSLNIGYSLTIPAPSSTQFKPNIFGNPAVTNLDVSAITATKDTSGTSYASGVAVLVNDPASVDNSSYKAILVAAKKPLACIFQDAYRAQSAQNAKTNQWVDLTQNTFQPRTFNSGYLESGVAVTTSFVSWPDFQRGAPMGTVGAGITQVALGAANSGFLRANTVYEFTYSLFNKRLGFESNVGTQVKIQTGTNDFVGLQLWKPLATGGSTTADKQTVQSEDVLGSSGGGSPMFPIFGDYLNGPGNATGYQSFINHLQYRFYYRQEGTFEWLPALYIDVPQFWFYPFNAQIMACTGAISALPGGQPGGFNDYSPLAKDNYICVAQYKDRAFWCSDKQINFSLRNNIFAYPARNSISAVAGEFKGMIVHNYPGQAEQNSRLIIFGTKETYVARFTGNLQQTNVQVSADTSGVFDLDGSDLEIDAWTSVTAFSYRSAVVAEGILYWWGPQGIFRDDGVETPTRISADLEPNLFTLYDTTQTDLIFGTYNNLTKEIEWIYVPTTGVTAGTTDVTTGVNKSIIYNTISGNFTPGSYSQQLDWMQQVDIGSPAGTGGYRNVVGTRLDATKTIQRAYFFDQRNRAGDFAPTRDWVIKAISAPSTGTRRLTLASGFDSTTFGRLKVGDLIALQQTRSYASTLAAASRMVTPITAITSNSFDITLPAGATLDSSASLTYDQYFPFWQSTLTGNGQNGYPYLMQSNYWTPAGTNGYFFWLYAYLLMKVRLWAGTDGLKFDFGYRTPTALASISDTITLSDNSDGNFQVYHQLRPGDDNQEGQGIKFMISGVHLGHEWVLQYMEAHARSIEFDGDPLKRFEG